MELSAIPGDEELWRLARHDPGAFGMLFERHARSVFAFCAWHCGDRHLAEDLTSTVFLEAWRKRVSVELAGSSALPYLLGVANNVTRNSRRAVRRYRGALGRLPHPEAVGSAEDDAVSRADSARLMDQARKALDGLTPAERSVFILVSWSALSYDEAATALGIPVGTVRSRLSRARQKLQSARAVIPADHVTPQAPPARPLSRDAAPNPSIASCALATSFTKEIR